MQDLSKLTETFDGLLEAIRSGEPEDAVVGDVLLIVEVIHGDKGARIRARPHDGARPHHVVGLLDDAAEKLTTRKAFAAARRAMQRAKDEAPADDTTSG